MTDGAGELLHPVGTARTSLEADKFPGASSARATYMYFIYLYIYTHTHKMNAYSSLERSCQFPFCGIGRFLCPHTNTRI